MAEITTSLVVQFSSGSAESFLSAEVDGRDDGRNGGNTSFIPGQVVYYLITKTPEVSITSQTTSAGVVEFIETSIEEKEETLVFANESQVSVGSPIHGAYTTKWLGNVPSATLLKTSPTTFSLQDSEGTSVDSVAVLKINYTVLHQVYKLSGLGSTLNGETSYDVVIVIIGESP